MTLSFANWTTKSANAEFQAFQEGQTCDGIRADYRQYPQGSHIIFYRVATDSVVEIIRILHKRMLPDGHLL
ncbi:type II toxin-antitoxin system RelE/ParE family toxin [Marinobacter shengliensis]